jgi:hypothetical protein
MRAIRHLVIAERLLDEAGAAPDFARHRATWQLDAVQTDQLPGSPVS